MTANDAFNSGVAHPANPGRSNLGSITLGGGLQAQSDRWNAESQQAGISPHSVLAPYSFSRLATSVITGTRFWSGSAPVARSLM